MSQLIYKPLGDEQNLIEAWARSGSISFGEDYDKILIYLDRLDRPKWCRVLLDDNTDLVGTLMRASLGMFVMGGRVRTESVGFVTIPPHHRGKRAGVEIMQHHLREAHEDGAAISVLYSARARLYRGVGYETAGRHSKMSIPLRTFKPRTTQGIDEVSSRELTEQDLPVIYMLHSQFARSINGYLDRDEWMWNYTRGVYAKRLRQGYIFEHMGKVTGYLFVHPGGPQGPKLGNETIVDDLCFSNAPTARAMIKFLASFNSASSTAKMGIDIAHPLFDHADELWYQVESSYLWMIRIIDIERAVSQRGYSPCLAGDVVVEITDSLLRHNNTRWHISVADGKGTATQTNAPAQASMDISAFAPIFTGYSTATQMHDSDRLDADSDAITILDGLFNAPTPVMADDF